MDHDGSDILASGSAWMRARCDMGRWGPLIRRICRRHGIGDVEPLPFRTGSAVVVALNDDLVLKIFHPRDGLDCARETSCFSIAGNDVTVPLPKAVASGVLDDYPYLVMTRLKGMPLVDAWNDVPPEQRRRLITDLGAVTRQLHGLVVPRDSPVVLDWPTHLADQRRTVVERQVSKGLSDRWWRQIASFLAVNPVADDEPAVLLHTELMRDHLLVDDVDGRWQLTGLYDFAEAITGPFEYEFASVGLFVSEGDGRLLRAFLGGYGYDDDRLDEALSRRLLAYTLYHHYANLPWYLERMAPPVQVTTLDGLARHWFGLTKEDG